MMSTQLHEDRSIDFTVGEDHGVGLTFTDGAGNKAVSVLGEELPRKALLKITSYRGLGLGIHWYGCIIVSGRRFRYTEMTDENHPWIDSSLGTLDISGPYDQWKPKEMLGLTIELTRPITAQEIKTDQEIGAGRFTQRAGDPTYAFRTREAVVAKAIAVFQRVFCGRWVLVKSMTGTPICATEEIGNEEKKNDGRAC